MNETGFFQKLAGWTADSYANMELAWRDARLRQLPAYHKLCLQRLEQLAAVLAEQTGGELLRQRQRRLRLLCDDFALLGGSIGAQRKLYICGCAGAGKSTLLNALLALEEDKGSPPERPPDSLIVNAFTPALPPGKAELRGIGNEGRLRCRSLTRDEALRKAGEEDAAFLRSRQTCRKKLEELCDGVWLEDERDGIRADTYRKNLRRAHIQEIRWGIETPSDYGWVLAEVPGFARELCAPDRVRELRSCECDASLWVIDALSLNKTPAVEAYHEELRLWEQTYGDRNMVLVVNLRDGGESLPGSPRWEGFRRKAEALFGKTHHIRAVLCANLQLAWEGAVQNDEELLEASNLIALRSRLNRLFPERGTEAYLTEQLARVDDAVTLCFREAEEVCADVDRLLAEHDERGAGLEELCAACRALLEEKKRSLLSRVLREINSRVRECAAAVNVMYQNADWDAALIEERILQKNALEKEMAQLIGDVSRETLKRFRAQRKSCVLTLNRSQPYQKAALRVYAKALSGEAEPAPVPLPDNICSQIALSAGGAFARSGSIIRNDQQKQIKSAPQRLYDELEGILRRWTEGVTLDPVIEAYARQCRETLDKSMTDACAGPDTARAVRAALRRLMEDRPRMEWQDVHVASLLGPAG